LVLIFKTLTLLKPSKHSFSFSWAVLWPASLLFLVGCDFQGRQSTFDPKGPVAQEQFDLFMITVWVTLFIFVVVGGALLWVVVRYRARKGDGEDGLPHQGHGNPLIELGLVLVSVGLLLIIAVPTVQAIWYTHAMPDAPESKLGAWYEGAVSEGAEDEVLIIRAYGWQWWFSFEYPQLGIVTGNEFAIPKGKVVRFELRSRDVIHSFWLPKLGGKVDMIPGRNNWMWLQGDEAGHYYGQCAEFCGEAHAYMLFRADVLETEDFAAWVEEKQQPAISPWGEDWSAFMEARREDPLPFEDDAVARGADLFLGRGACIQCHRIDGSIAAGALGPDLTHIGSRVTAGAGWLDHRDETGQIDRARQFENLRRWIGESEKIKPGNLMHWGTGGLKDVDLSERDVSDLTEFMIHLQ